MARREDDEGISGGRFIPNAELPPTREYRLQTPARRRVAVDFDNAYHFGGIAAIQPGQCIITDAWAEIGGSRVAEVAPGATFDIKCSYVAQDLALSPINRTLMCITVKDTTGQIRNYEDTLLEWGGIGSSGTVKLGKLGNNIMPDADINLNFKMWFNDDSNIQPGYPPESNW